MRRTKWLLAAVAGMSLCAVRPARAAVTYTTVALSGQQAPGFADGVKFTGVGDALMNMRGQVSFGAGLTGPGIDSNNSGSSWVGGPGELQLVYQTGTPAPDAGGTQIAFFPFFNLGISDSGEVAYAGLLSPLNSGGAGLWIGKPGAIHMQAPSGSIPLGQVFSFPGLGPLSRPPVYAASDQIRVVFGAYSGQSGEPGYWMATSTGVQPIVVNGTPAPGTPIGVTYSFFGPEISPPAVSPDGQVAIQCTIQGPGVTNANNSGIWAGPLGALLLVARAGDPAVGLGGQAQYGQFAGGFGAQPVVITHGGQLAFAGSLAGPGIDATNNSALWVGKAGAVQLLARSGDPAAQSAAGVTWRNIDGPLQISVGGETFFSAIVSGPGVDPNHSRGYWAGTPGSLHLLALPGAPAWGLPSDVRFGDISLNFSVNPLGNRITVGYAASLTGNGVNNSNDSGIWAGTGGNIKLVAREGEQAPGLPAGITFGDLVGSQVSPALNSLGEIAFACGIAGPGIDRGNSLTLWATDAKGNLSLIARTGDLFDVSGGDLRTIKGLQLIKKYQQIYGEVGAAPDEFGRIGFEAEFTDGSSGIFFATVPEPTGLGLIVVGTTLLGRRMRIVSAR
jgi:hypothetical protein